MTRVGFTGAAVHAGWGDAPVGDALVVEGERVAWVGRRRDIPEVDRTLDLGGAVIGPGLTDAHVHLYAVAAARLNFDAGSAAVTSIDDLIAGLARHARTLPADGWAVAAGFDENRLKDLRYPTRAELDAAVPDRPALVRRFCGHIAVANSAALAALGIDEAVSDPDGGAFGRDAAGRLDGRALEAAADLIFRDAPRPDRRRMVETLQRLIAELAGLGLTAAVEAAVGFTDGYETEFDTWVALRRLSPVLPVRLGFMHRLDARDAAARGLRPTTDSDWQETALKFFADGIVGGRTAAVATEYADGTGHGFFMRDEAELRRALVEAHCAGWQVAVHAAGDRAVSLVIESYEEGQRQSPRSGLPHRIEHAFSVGPDAYRRMRALGVAIVTQPSFLSRMNRSIHAAFADRAATCYAGRSVLDAGVSYVPSSDAPTGALSPWFGAADAVDRGASGGLPVGPREALSGREVLAGYAEEGARVMGHGAWRGRLDPGLAADLIAVDGDPTTASAEDLRRTRVLLTAVRGHVVHDLIRASGGSAP